MLNDLGLAIWKIRTAHRHTITDMAKKTGIDQLLIKRMENEGFIPLPEEGVVDKIIAAYRLDWNGSCFLRRAFRRARMVEKQEIEKGSIMTNNTVGRGSDQFSLRFPDGMRDELKEVAKANGRSMNAEIIARLEDYNDSQSNSNSLVEIRQTLNKHDEKLDTLADMLGRLCEVINANTQRT